MESLVRDERGLPRAPVRLEIAVVPEERLVVLRGELCMASAARLERRLRAMELAAGHPRTLDCRELDFIDLTGLDVLLDAAERARDADERIEVMPSPAFVRLLQLLCMNDDLLSAPGADATAPGDGPLRWRHPGPRSRRR